ncbi:zinc-binding alcohol dehydrogenase family protein [Oryzobacter telluris]|uniref:quinone oxidoreductase family protein n=1 Tax=Oryzobacter telluris TaxID=3149179 RepID=UPI00370D4CBC
MKASRMRAAVVTTRGSAPGSVEVRRVPLLRPRPGWVTVRLRAAGLNRLDAMMLEVAGAGEQGAIFGSDGAGVVAEIGHDPRWAVSPLGVGDCVVICPSLYWGASRAAPSDEYEILGSPTSGTHAEYVCVPAENLHPKPSHLTFVEAAALPMAALTAWRALVTRGRLTRGEKVVVGAASSGVGSMAIQIAASLGARVVAVTSSPDKAAIARRLGAQHVVDRTSTDMGASIAEHLDGPADLALDPTGSLWQPFAEVLRSGGRLVVVGQIATPVGLLRVQTLYWRQLDVLGSSMGSSEDFAAMLDNVNRYQWAPSVDSTFPLAAIGEAYSRLHSPNRSGKVVIDLDL